MVAASSLALPGSVADLPLSAGAFFTWSEEGNPEIQVAVNVGRMVEALDPVLTNPTLQLYFAAVSDDRKLLDPPSHIVSWQAADDGSAPGMTGTN